MQPAWSSLVITTDELTMTKDLKIYFPTTFQEPTSYPLFQQTSKAST
jgi:hypothetical protein